MSQNGTPVLHVIETGGPGGAETVLATIVNGLPDDLWHSRVVLPSDDWLLARLRERNVEAVQIRSKGSADLRYLRGLSRQIRSLRPAVIHAHLLASGVYGTLAAVLAGGTPLVCTFHGKPDVNPDDRFLKVKARILTRPLNRVVYVSHDLRQHLEPMLGIPEHLGTTIHNGVPFTDPVLTGREREEAGAGPDDILIGAVGNLRHPKDYPNLLRAASIVCAQRKDIKFAVAGGGGGRLGDELEAMRVELGLTESFRFLGFRDDASALMRSFDLFVSSSASEGLPLATLEAMGMGKPVVLTRCGGPAEIVDSGRNGILVPPQDPEALARGLLDMLGAPERMAAMAAVGAEEVRRRFSVGQMLDSYQDLYRSLMRLRRG